jgi:hypothetical protein
MASGGAQMNTNDIKKLQTMASDFVRIGFGYSCAFTLKGQSLECQWSPNIPPAKTIKKILASGKYHEARHDFLTAMAEQIGGTILCVGA